MLVFLPDTNILLSVRLLDLVMRSHAAGLIEVVRCDDLMDEYGRAPGDVRVAPDLISDIVDSHLAQLAAIDG